MEKQNSIKVGVLMGDIARSIGINPHESERCVAHGFVPDKETARKLMLGKKAVLPAKPRTVSVDVSAYWSNQYWGAYPNVRFSVSNEYFIRRRDGRPSPLPPDMIEELVDDESGDKSGAYYDMSRSNIWIMIGKQTLVEDEKRRAQLLKQYGQGLNTSLLNMIENDHVELHFLDLKYPIDGSSAPRLGRDGWQDEMPFRLDRLMYAVDQPMLSDHPKKVFAPSWAGGTEVMNEGESQQEEVYEPFLAVTGSLEHTRSVSAAGSKKSTNIVASGIILGRFRKNGKHVLILMDIKTALRFCASFLCFRCSPGFVQAVGGALLLPSSLLPADALKLDDKPADNRVQQPANGNRPSFQEQLQALRGKLGNEPPAVV